MTAYPGLWPLERSYENIMWVLPYVISNYRMMQNFSYCMHFINHLFQSSSPPPPSPSPPLPSTPSPSPPSPPSQIPALGILHFNYSSTKSSNTLLPAKPNPQLLACAQRSHFHPYQRSPIHHHYLAPSNARLSERWEWEFLCYQLAPSKAISTANNMFPAKPDPLLPAKLDPAWAACYQPSQTHSYQPSQVHCQQLAPSQARLSERWEWAFHHYQLAPSKARSTSNSLLPVKPDCQRWERAFHHYQLAPGEFRSTATSKGRSTATSETRSTANSLLPAKPDCQRWEWAFHHYQLAPNKARSTPASITRSTANSLLPAKPDCQRGESEQSATTSLLPAKPDPPLPPCSQRSHIVREVGVSMSLQWDQAYLRLESEYVRVLSASRSLVKVSMSELEWERVCQSC